MVLYVTKYNIHPDKAEQFEAWVESVIPRLLAPPGVIEFRAYRPVAGPFQVVTTIEFADLATWATIIDSEVGNQINNELHTLALDVQHEIWGASQNFPAPLRPGQ